MAKRLAYYLGGFACGAAAGLLLELALGKPPGSFSLYVIANGCGAIAVSIAEAKKKVLSIDEAKRPITIFPHGIP